MIGDLMTYALLVGIFVVQGLRLFVDKPCTPAMAPVRPRFLLKRRNSAADSRG